MIFRYCDETSILPYLEQKMREKYSARGTDVFDSLDIMD